MNILNICFRLVVLIFFVIELVQSHTVQLTFELPDSEIQVKLNFLISSSIKIVKIFNC